MVRKFFLELLRLPSEESVQDLKRVEVLVVPVSLKRTRGEIASGPEELEVDSSPSPAPSNSRVSRGEAPGGSFRRESFGLFPADTHRVLISERKKRL